MFKIDYLKENKKILLIILSSVLIIVFCSFVIGNIKKHNYFKKHTGKIIWKEKPGPFVSSSTNHFLGKDVKLNVYTVVPGLHYWKIANENEVDIDTLIGCNPFLNNLNAWIGEKIVIINKKGVLHYVQGNETLGIISKLYDVRISQIVKNNHLGLFRSFKKGDILFIPDAKPMVVTEKMNVLLNRRKMFRVPTNGWVAGRPFGWLMHPIYKKMRFHKGIDMKCSHGTPIFAAAPGKVIYAGRGRGYGKLIKIDHQNGYQTYYAHCSRIFVRTGDEVKEHQVIGRVGKTGLATVSHLHFEIRTNGKPIDPMKFLW